MVTKHRILITGSNGFVGYWLSEELANRAKKLDIEVLPVGFNMASGINVDVSDANQVHAIIESFRPTAVIHLAAIAAPMEAQESPRRAWEINFSGSLNIALALKEKTPDARLVFISSSEVYGASFQENNNKPITEDALLQPLNVYGATKAAADIMIGQMAYNGLRTIRFRPFGHTGPQQSTAFVVSSFARQIAEISLGQKPPIVHVGNLTAFRDLLDVRDVVRAYVDAAIHDKPDAIGNAFNLSSAKARSIQSILENLIQLSDSSIAINVDPERLRKNEIECTLGDSTSAYSTFGWAPQISFEQTLKDVFTFWKNQLRKPHGRSV